MAQGWCSTDRDEAVISDRDAALAARPILRKRTPRCDLRDAISEMRAGTGYAWRGGTQINEAPRPINQSSTDQSDVARRIGRRRGGYCAAGWTSMGWHDGTTARMQGGRNGPRGGVRSVRERAYFTPM